MTPPFSVPDPTDPAEVANAAQGAQEFRTLKDYLVSWISILFNPSTGQVLYSTVWPPSSIPAFTGDATTPAPSSSISAIVVTNKGLNGVILSALTTGLLKNTTGTGAPTIAIANTDYLALSAIGTLVKAYYESGQEPGTATNDSASGGNIGQEIQQLVPSGFAVALSTGSAANITSISLTAGDWDVEGNVNFTLSSASVTAESAGISTTSVTVPTDGSEVYSGLQTTTTSIVNAITLPRKRISIAGTTTVYLVAKVVFSAGAMGGFGAITARRVR